MLCEFPGVFFLIQDGFFDSFSLVPLDILVLRDSAPVAHRPHRIIMSLAKEMGTTRIQHLSAGLIQPSNSPCSSSLVVTPQRSGDVRITSVYNKAQRHQQTSPARESGPGVFGLKKQFLPLRPKAIVPIDNRAQDYGSTRCGLHPSGPLRVDCHASEKQCIASLVFLNH